MLGFGKILCGQAKTYVNIDRGRAMFELINLKREQTVNLHRFINYGVLLNFPQGCVAVAVQSSSRGGLGPEIRFPRS